MLGALRRNHYQSQTFLLHLPNASQLTIPDLLIIVNCSNKVYRRDAESAEGRRGIINLCVISASCGVSAVN